MKYIVLIYNDPDLLGAVPQGEQDAMLRGCFAHVDHLSRDGHPVESRMLAEANTAKSIRVRDGRVTTVDGPFAEAKEVLGGFNLIEAENMDEAVRIASEFPWARTGCVEVRAVQDLDAVRQRVGAPAAPERATAGAAA
ncbi:YciI family protein [Longimicrobium sp.]|uniref:YciI family protein n=1 Tax=Longimicrobium sp. TaxID=2029185 RepID=UPI002BE933D2|nr:YciI family protein [Longimicrobium sp.]HSU14084.1 YciI family protein [Longimicrobium sp.]